VTSSKASPTAASRERRPGRHSPRSASPLPKSCSIPTPTTGDAEVILPSPVVADGTIGSLRHHELISLAFDMITTRLADDISRGVVRVHQRARSRTTASCAASMPRAC
jgi:hypothetical protein